MNNSDLKNKFERGIISVDEYEEIIAKKSENNLNIHEKLENKLLQEYTNFINELMSKSKEDILNSAYEVTCKQEIKDTLCNIDLDDLEIKALLEEENILTEFYHDWLDCDVPLGNSMEYCIQDSIDVSLRCYNKNKNRKQIER